MVPTMAGKPTVLVVGGGTMGRGIAALCASTGHQTRLFEVDAAARGGLRSSIESSWQRAAASGRLDPGDLEKAHSLLHVIESLEEAAGADCAIEAVPESLELKRSVFGQLDSLCSSATLLGSNTSSLSISAIAAATRRPERVVGIHFFNPVAAMPLVEIVSGSETSAATRQRAVAFAESLGKRAIRVSDTPGFATSRLGLALGLEAMRMVEEGVAGVEDIDLAMELGYGHRMGPLKTSDLVGLDVRLAIADALASRLNEERFRAPGILRTLVDRGHTGRKSGRGFYRWDGQRPVEPAVTREGEP
ncbi:MAG TPA: 3-hydroxyacyl-CoA dehydrogenase family protein [Thermoanaerobaculia bacterium]|nr:3-hydroxyacyl-CoA dehydrogenase family protein [Thermoanaerobaculia bacterium]